MLNYLYCFDANYNIQAFNSISSLLANSINKINLFIIHKDKNSFEKYANKIQLHKNLNQLNVYQFEAKELSEFPRIKNTHVSEATYYRLVFDQYLPHTLDFITYIDADIICVKSPDDAIQIEINNLKKSENIISVKTESLINEEHMETRDRLKLKNNKYFNAGVKIVNFQKWKENSISKQLLIKLIEINEEIYFWDQDVLNAFFDGEYNELNKFLNFNLYLTGNDYFDKTSKNERNEMIFIHYAGSFKPWSIRGILNPKSKYYQDEHMKKNNNNYHIVNTWRMDSLYRLFFGIFTFRIMFVRKPIRFIYNALKSILN